MTHAQADRRDLSTMSMRWLEVVISSREQTIAALRREIARLTADTGIEAANWERISMSRRDLDWELSFYEEANAEMARRTQSAA